ncbi:MAG: SPOR domain-containing protein [Bryobacterales bacterium]|nr:SPOR domain-containing protein [Bryobacteraceae bacterium]MDW8130354.1 SPOR domain-containing protein [Bryobacterales bacterium]
MPRNEEGEYELVLGTPQLLSVIFILIVLLGVVFSAGYFLGRTAGGQIAAAPDDSSKRAGSAGATAVQPGQTGVRATPSGLPPEAATPLEPGEAKVATGGSAGTAGQESGPWPPATPPQTQPTPPPAATTPPPGQPGAGAPAVAEPEPGQTFLQVAAVRRNEAEFLADVLKRKGFASRVAPGPSETLFRVLVGPLKDEEEIAHTRKRLEEAGFRSSYVRRY